MRLAGGVADLGYSARQKSEYGGVPQQRLRDLADKSGEKYEAPGLIEALAVQQLPAQVNQKQAAADRQDQRQSLWS